MNNFNSRIISIVLLVSLLTIGIASATKEVLTTSGTWTCPENVTYASATLVAGGGGGTPGSPADENPYGGGLGGQAGNYGYAGGNVIPGNKYQYVVGDGGMGGYQLPGNGEICRGVTVGAGMGGDTSMFGITVRGGYHGLLSGYGLQNGSPGEISYWSPFSNGGHGGAICPPGTGLDATNGSGGEIILVYNEYPVNVTNPILINKPNINKTINKQNESLIDYIFRIL